MASKTYVYNKRWRVKNREAFNEGKKLNYARGKINVAHARDEWTLAQLEKIIQPGRSSDRTLAKELGRSVQAIQVMRSRLKKGTIQIDTDSGRCQ